MRWELLMADKTPIFYKRLNIDGIGMLIGSVKDLEAFLSYANSTQQSLKSVLAAGMNG